MMTTFFRGKVIEVNRITIVSIQTKDYIFYLLMKFLQYDYLINIYFQFFENLQP